MLGLYPYLEVTCTICGQHISICSMWASKYILIGFFAVNILVYFMEIVGRQVVNRVNQQLVRE